jgi:putative transposase
VPGKITIDGSQANAAALASYNAEHGTAIEVCQVRYLNNIMEQDHRAVKRITRPRPGFKSFDAAQCTLAGIELMPMLKKGHLAVEEGEAASRQQNSSTPRQPDPQPSRALCSIP